MEVKGTTRSGLKFLLNGKRISRTATSSAAQSEEDSEKFNSLPQSLYHRENHILSSLKRIRSQIPGSYTDHGDLS